MNAQIIDCEQGSDAWRLARLGIATASEFSSVLAKGQGKTRKAYMLKLAGERFTGQPADSYSNLHMERGHEMEDEARRLYSFMRDIEPIRVGFVRSGDVGCSPDSLLGDDGGLEIKSALPHIQIERLLAGALPSEHVAQVQGSMWVCERPYWDFMSYCPRLPPLILRVERDDKYIAMLADEVGQFNRDLEAMVARIKDMGAQTYTEAGAPVQYAEAV